MSGSETQANCTNMIFTPEPFQYDAVLLPHTLPAIDNEERNNFDKLFAASGIAAAAGLLPKLAGQKRDADIINEQFVGITLNDYVIHTQKFVTSVKRFISATPPAYQAKIGKAPNVQLRVFAVILSWDLDALHSELSHAQNDGYTVTVEKLIVFVFLMYRPLLQLLFLGEVHFNTIIDKSYQEIRSKTNASLPSLTRVVDEIKYEWGYLFRTVVRDLYPLLMRICSSYCVSLQKFLDDNIQRIMIFLQLKREEIILPEQFRPVIYSDADLRADRPDTAYTVLSRESGQRLAKGLKLLDMLFPEAGWKSLQTYPDMYPYYQPLFSFSEGFNLLSPKNPMQAAVILMRIIEDLFSGCIKIDLRSTTKNDAVQMSAEEIERSLGDWYLARMNVFDKEYAQSLKEYVNRVYSHKDFRTTTFGMKKLSTILGLEKSEFFPYLKFEFSYMENATSAYGSQPVYKKVAKLARYFDWLADNITESLEKNGGKPGLSVVGIGNPWEKYVFALGNVTSLRLNVLLGGKNSLGPINANLIVSVAQLLAVLDWLMNNPQSVAYVAELHEPYRNDDITGDPVFNVPLRNDVEYLFERENKKK